MLKEVAQYLVSLKDNKTYQIHGDTYSDRELVRIAPHIDRPTPIKIRSLDGLVNLIQNEYDVFSDRYPIFVDIQNPRTVSVFTTFGDEMQRDFLYVCECDAPKFDRQWMDHEEAIIALRSMFVQDESSDIEYVLKLLSSISNESSVTSSDNGLSQTVETRQGVALNQRTQVRPRVTLRPYRTFLEVIQPASEFLLRLDKSGRVGLLPADSGMWTMTAKDSIEFYVSMKLKSLIEKHYVVVMK